MPRKRKRSDENLDDKVENGSFLKLLDGVGALAWTGQGCIDVERSWHIQKLGIRLSAIERHMRLFPGDFPLEFRTVLRNWMMGIILLNYDVQRTPIHRYHLDEDIAHSAFVIIRLRNHNELHFHLAIRDGNIEKFTIWDHQSGIPLIRYAVNRDPNLRYHGSLQLFDEAKWNRLIEGELPNDMMAPGSSFILRFLLFLAGGSHIDISEPDDLHSIAYAAGNENQLSFDATIYERYPFFQEYWQFLKHQVESTLNTDILLHDLTKIILAYSICPPKIGSK